jgi:glutaredoxin
MSEPVARIALAAGATALALGIALQARAAERRRAAAGPLDLSGIAGRLVLFTAAGCRRCEPARNALTRTGVDFVEVAFDEQPDRVRAIGVAAVPLLVGRDASGAEVGRIAGRIGRRALSRLLSRVGES